MSNITIVKILKNPGFLYDLNYLFYLHFNTQRCLDCFENEAKKEENSKYFSEILKHFGKISDDLYVFYHAIGSGRCFITTHYVDPYKDLFSTKFDFNFFKNELSDVDGVVEKLARFYLGSLTDEELEAALVSKAKLFEYIKASDYTDEEKSRLYEFFINPAPYIQTLIYELMEKEIALSAYYKDNYEKLIEASNNITFESLSENLKGIDDLSFLKDKDQKLYVTFCLLNQYCLNLYLVPNGAVYFLGIDYIVAINDFIKNKKTEPIDKLCAALGDENRFKILMMIKERGEVTCKDLERAFDFSGSTAYHHLTMLVRAGAVSVRNEGKTICYSINRNNFDKMISSLSEFSNNRKGNIK